MDIALLHYFPASYANDRSEKLLKKLILCSLNTQSSMYVKIITVAGFLNKKRQLCLLSLCIT